METTRLLLPFQHGVERAAIEQAVRLAKGCGATLVALSILSVQGRGLKAPRLDFIQQSNDFLEATKHLAKVWGVPLESFEVFSHDSRQAIDTVASEMQCDGVVLFLGRSGGVLLSADTIEYLVEKASYKLFVMHLQTRKRNTVVQALRAYLGIPLKLTTDIKRVIKSSSQEMQERPKQRAKR